MTNMAVQVFSYDSNVLIPASNLPQVIITYFIVLILLPMQINNIQFPSTCPLNAVFQSFGHSPSVTPDDDVFRHLSLVYSKNHAKMSRGVSCKSGSPRFENGITNGAAWYPLTGNDEIIHEGYLQISHRSGMIVLLQIHS